MTAELLCKVVQLVFLTTCLCACQVTTFSLFRLMREIDGDLSDEQLIDWPAHSTSSSDHSSTELLLVQYVKQGAFSKLCRVLGEVDDGSAHDLAFSMLLSMSIVPEVAQLVADRNDISQIVKVSQSLWQMQPL